MDRPRLLVYASGGPKGGGSGARELAENSRTGVLWADVVGFVSNHEHGGVRQHADSLGIEFYYLPNPRKTERESAHQAVIEHFRPDFVALSGWLRLFPTSVLGDIVAVNIHPGRLPKFGGKGMHGHHVHEAVIEAFRRSEITHTAVTMHFVNDKYDDGSIFFEYPILIRDDDTPDTIAARVNKIEHGWQSFITNLVVTGQIYLEKGGQLIVPEWYELLPQTV